MRFLPENGGKGEKIRTSTPFTATCRHFDSLWRK